jgi:hypothetical protein
VGAVELLEIQKLGKKPSFCHLFGTRTLKSIA